MDCGLNIVVIVFEANLTFFFFDKSLPSMHQSNCTSRDFISVDKGM